MPYKMYSSAIVCEKPAIVGGDPSALRNNQPQLDSVLSWVSFQYKENMSLVHEFPLES